MEIFNFTLILILAILFGLTACDSFSLLVVKCKKGMFGTEFENISIIKTQKKGRI